MNEINNVVAGRRVKVVPDVIGERIITSDLGRYILLEWSYVIELDRRLR